MTCAELIERAATAQSDAAAEIDAASTLDELTEIDRRYLGKGSPLNTVREAIKTVDGPDRASVGQAVSAARTLIEEKIATRRDALSAGDRDAALAAERLDLTIGGRDYRRGHLHPVTRIWRELEDVFVGLGYTVAEGPEVELDWYNFEALNFPPGHPLARCRTRSMSGWANRSRFCCARTRHPCRSG